MSWAKSHWDLLKPTRWIGGDPSQGEIYGYSHSSKAGLIVTLRNPQAKAQELEVPASWPEVTEIFPRTRAIPVGKKGKFRARLEPWEVAVFVAGAANDGARFR